MIACVNICKLDDTIKDTEEHIEGKECMRQYSQARYDAIKDTEQHIEEKECMRNIGRLDMIQ